MSALRNNATGERSSLRSLRYQPPDMDNKRLDDLKARIQGSLPSAATANGDKTYNGAVPTKDSSLSRDKSSSFSSSRYVPLSERTGLTGYSPTSPESLGRVSHKTNKTSLGHIFYCLISMKRFTDIFCKYYVWLVFWVNYYH